MGREKSGGFFWVVIRGGPRYFLGVTSFCENLRISAKPTTFCSPTRTGVGAKIYTLICNGSPLSVRGGDIWCTLRSVFGSLQQVVGYLSILQFGHLETPGLITW